MRIVLTGSSSGIGRALAERLLRRGHEVCGLARSDQSEFEQAHPGRFFSLRTDVAVWESVNAAVRGVGERWGSFDGLVCAAGLLGEVGPALAADAARWTATVRANLEGTFHTLRAFHPLLRPRSGRGKIICFSGGGSTQARPGFSAYGVAKTGIVRLVETIAQETGGQALDINALAPGAIATRMTDEVIRLGPDIVGRAEFESALRQKEAGAAPLERALDLAEWLLSPVSDGITGRLLSAPWDPWATLAAQKESLARSDLYTLRRKVPTDGPTDPARPGPPKR